MIGWKGPLLGVALIAVTEMPVVLTAALSVTYKASLVIAISQCRTKVGTCALLFGKQVFRLQALPGHCTTLALGISFVVVRTYGLWRVSENKKSRWLWPLGLLATGLAGVGVMIFRGCWHSRMSWPVRAQQHSYQVCLGCGIKRLFDEQSFRAYGPFSYDLNRLIAWDLARRGEVRAEPDISTHRTAS